MHQGQFSPSLRPHLLLQQFGSKQVRMLMMGHHGRKPKILYLLCLHHLHLLHNDHRHHQVTVLTTMGWYHLIIILPALSRTGLITPLFLSPNSSSSPFIHLRLHSRNCNSLLRDRHLNRTLSRPMVT